MTTKQNLKYRKKTTEQNSKGPFGGLAKQQVTQGKMIPVHKSKRPSEDSGIRYSDSDLMKEPSAENSNEDRVNRVKEQKEAATHVRDQLKAARTNHFQVEGKNYQKNTAKKSTAPVHVGESLKIGYEDDDHFHLGDDHDFHMTPLKWAHDHQQLEEPARKPEPTPTQSNYPVHVLSNPSPQSIFGNLQLLLKRTVYFFFNCVNFFNPFSSRVQRNE